MSDAPQAAAASQPGSPQQARLTGLVRALRGVGLDPDGQGIADALWLAQYSRPTAGPQAADTPRYAGDPRAMAAPDAAADAPPRPPSGPAGAATGPTDDLAPGRAVGQEETITLYTDPAGTEDTLSNLPRDALRVGVPEARALPGLLALERALRPLRRYQPPAPPPRASVGRLDEGATVERTARAGGLLLPVFHPPARGHVELQLLMDAASTMRVWQRLLTELTEVFSRLGAFRDIQVHYLHKTPDGTPAVSRRFECDGREARDGRDSREARDGDALRPVRQLSDPTGRRLTVVVSDCTGPLWQAGAAHRLLHQLSRHAPVAVVQPLPQRLWARTWLPVSHGTLLREEGVAASTRLRFSPSDPRVPARSGRPGHAAGATSGAVPVPVLPPTATALGAWAGLLAGPADAGAVRAAVGWARADQPAAATPRRKDPAASRPAVDPLARFRATASPSAVRLAAYLSAAPLFLPVMQLIQRTMLPDSGPAELSEVMLSGLLRRREGSDGRWYEFVDGVDEQLLAALGQDEAALVLKHCSDFVERRFGRTGPNFPALALAQLTRESTIHGGTAPSRPPTPPEPVTGQQQRQRRLLQPFAEVAAKVLRRFLPTLPPIESGESGEPGEPGEPDVPGSPASPGAESQREARAHTTEAAARARELVARFDEDGRVGHLIAAADLLREAATDAPDAGQAASTHLWSELAETLLRLWREQRDGALLREARQAAADAASPPASVRARTVLARVLIEQAREQEALGDDQGARELWRQADRELAAVSATPGLGVHEALASVLERVAVLEGQWRLGGDSGLLQESVGMVEAIVDAWPAGDPVPSSLLLAHGRALLRLATAEPDTTRAQGNAEQAAESLERGCQALVEESAPATPLARALLDQIDALHLTEQQWRGADTVIVSTRQLIDGAELGPEPKAELHGACLIRAARWHDRRFIADGAPDDLVSAATRFAEASRLVPRDRPEYAELLHEWGASLLRRAGLADGTPFIARAVRVLRDCRMETPRDDERLPERLLLLGHALMARYERLSDLVDLREAEHLFGLAANGATDTMTRARCRFEEGEAHRLTHHHTRRPERLDLAAEAYRRAVAAAHEAEPTLPNPAPAIRLAARALYRRGTVYELDHRRLAAADAYRQALRHWQRLVEFDEADDAVGREGAEETRQRLTQLETDRQSS